MELSKQVISLDIAKRLKELGVKQESLFYWRYAVYGITEASRRTINQPPVWEICDGQTKAWYENDTYFSAYSVAELGEMLPWMLDYKEKKYLLTINHAAGFYFRYQTIENELLFKDYMMYEPGESMADSGGLMLIYLLEQGIIKP